ncbi:Pyridine nucleotide-disulfide oxidoreductase OS=Streptomyces antimycoticus OX=68175 GN=hcaD_1 PE=4 SV=1 [Streptomyces antimycoticus]
MICPGEERRPHLWTPYFWSAQFGVNIKSIRVPNMADQIIVSQGSLGEHRFTAAYGYQGRNQIRAVTFDQAKWLEFYQRQIEQAAPFPPPFTTVDRRAEGMRPVPAGFPDPSVPTHGPQVTVAAELPTDQRITSPPPDADPDARADPSA